MVLQVRAHCLVMGHRCNLRVRWRNCYRCLHKQPLQLWERSRTAESVQEAVRSDKRSALARLVKTPESFKHDNRKDEVKYFADWLWNFRRWLEASDSEYAGELDAVEAEQNKTRVNSDMRPETAERSVALYAALGTLVQGRAQRIVRSVQNGSGYEAYRLLISNFMPANKQRAVALLQHICTYPIFLRGSLLKKAFWSLKPC